MGFVLVMTKEVDLPSAWGHTPLRGFQFARVALKEQDKMRGGFLCPPRGRNAGLRGSAWHRLVLFCSLFRGGNKKKRRGKKRKGGAGTIKGSRKGGLVACGRDVVGTGGTSVVGNGSFKAKEGQVVPHRAGKGAGPV